ncbi:hypothetical protein D9M68_1005160 [compost metagenome]
MSMTMTLREASARTASATAVNSSSTKNTRASAWRRMASTALVSRRVLIVFRTAPDIGTAKCASTMAGTLGAMIDTTSPGPILDFRSASAS